MKALSEIGDSRQLEHERALLLRQLHKQERAIDKDMQRISNHWSRWKKVGNATSNIVSLLMPSINMFTVGIGLAKRLFRKKK